MKPNNKLIDLRKSKGLTQLEFSALVGVSRSTIADIERGSIPMSKRVKIKIVGKLSLETGYFDDTFPTEIDIIKQGNDAGYRQGLDSKNDFLGEKKDHKKSSIFPNEYFNDENFYLKRNFEKKLLVDIIANHKYINELYSYLNTLASFEYIIDNLNHYYFNKIERQFHSSENYLKDGKFQYDSFKQDFIKEIEKIEHLRPALSNITASIEAFYKEFREFDTENIISGYFGEKKPD